MLAFILGVVMIWLYFIMATIIQALFNLIFTRRLTQIKRECAMAEVMTRFCHEGLGSMKVNEKWWLGTPNGECYDRLVSHLSSLPQISSPLDKLQQASKHAHFPV